MAIYDVSASSTVYITQACPVSNKKTVPFYGSVQNADNYFYLHEKYADWACHSREDKLRFLTSASRRIDRLNFICQKADENQLLQFPRTGDTRVPVVIEQATYELAMKLGTGIDPDTEAENLSRTISLYGSMRSVYDRSFVPEYTRCGIPSQTAWNLLYPYLRSNLHLEILRTS